MFKDIKKFFSDFINNLRQKRAFRYSPLIAIPCLIAILIPTILAVWHVYFKDDKLFDAHDVTVTLYNNDNKINMKEHIVFIISTNTYQLKPKKNIASTQKEKDEIRLFIK